MIIKDVPHQDWFSVNTAAAGVLPVFIDEESDDEGGQTTTGRDSKKRPVFALLGREAYRPLFPASLLLCDFGGSTKRKFSTAFECACAEFHQESCGAFMNIDSTPQAVASYVRNRVVGVFHCLSQNIHQKDYIVYVMRVSKKEAQAAIAVFADNRADFIKKSQGCGRHRVMKDYLEKDLLCGVHLDKRSLILSRNLFRVEFFDLLMDIIPTIVNIFDLNP